MLESYDAIVVGLGAMGSAAAYQLAKRGQRVLGLEMFEPGHDQGSSHGHHRMIRKSATQDDGYVPLADRAFERWSELEAESGQELLRTIGEVRLVQSDSDDRHGATASDMLRRGFWEVLDEPALRERFPGFRLYDGMLATFEADAGFLWSERGIIAHVEVAARHGATIHTGEEVTGWASDGAGLSVNTTRGTYRTARLILTVGPWAPELLVSLQYPYRVIRSINAYFAPERPDWWTAEAGAPDFLLDVPEGSYYGIPSVDGIGVKIGRSATEWGTETTARTINRRIDDSEVEMMRAALDKYMPGAAGAELKRITCMCTYTVDGDFIIDRHPDHAGVILACGFSGRGYKFAPTVGEILADLATTGATRHDIGFLSAARFASGMAGQAAV
jgi:sarcosine oxidase